MLLRSAAGGGWGGVGWVRLGVLRVLGGMLATARRAIWVEAADEHWEAAATLAHIAVANHHGSAGLWQQAWPPRTDA